VDALTAVKDRESGASAIAPHMVSGITLQNDGRVGFILTLLPGQQEKRAWIEQASKAAVAALPGVTAVTALLTAETGGGAAGEISRGETGSSGAPRVKAQWNTTPIPHVKRLIAVASGKGGVGKSTTAVNLAHALRAAGRRVGLLDADIYGPSIPRMMGLSGKPEIRNDLIVPLVSHGIACMSMGLLVAEDSALVWRGPQVTKALYQMLRLVAWASADAPLDALLVDTPPGTGDIHLSLAQQAPVNGAVIVTTPQDVAVADARKCIDMFRKVHVPLLGVIENMSGFSDPQTGKVHAIFGAGGGKRLAESCAVPFLGEVPIDIALRQASDNGQVFKDTEGIYTAIARKL
jgi:ATP-binding protein involved in chromosome partitioning